MTAAGITFTGLHLACDDIEATAEFYRLLGIPIAHDAAWTPASGAHHIADAPMPRAETSEISFDSLALARVYNAGQRDAPNPAALIVGFRLPSRQAVDDLHGKLVAAGYTSRQ